MAREEKGEWSDRVGMKVNWIDSRRPGLRKKGGGGRAIWKLQVGGVGAVVFRPALIVYEEVECGSIAESVSGGIMLGEKKDGAGAKRLSPGGGTLRFVWKKWADARAGWRAGAEVASHGSAGVLQGEVGGIAIVQEKELSEVRGLRDYPAVVGAEKSRGTIPFSL